MEMESLHSIQEISKQYNTGDLPVLVLCSDTQQYICKYMRPNATISYKLACEFMGADIFAHIIKSVSPKQLTEAVKRLEKDYLQCISRSKKQSVLLAEMPKEWAVPTNKLENKVEELFSQKWINDTWENFVECLKSYSNYGK